ncbi:MULTISPECIES: oligosaccharide flippase family protein [Staphylococcus]|uniref:oligosaccharide flippase family protein n=1 Tax=Staphylococcus TaxID=1279 RepID=UPI0018DD5EFE|nr:MULTISPECIES: oligosaccharide flippase family protein [Staphylococcus]QPW17801.1 oligosaccharide flippase family protein [Staphylococcus saprophyticus]
MIKKIGTLMISNILFGFSQMIIIVFLNKYGGVSIVGQYTLALSIVAPITVFLNMGLNLHYNTSKKEVNISDYLYIRYSTGILMVVISIITGILLDQGNYLILIIFMISILKFIESLFEINYAFLQKKEMHNLISYSKIIRSIIIIVWIVIISFLIDLNLIIMLTGFIIFSFIILYSFDFKNVNKIKENRSVSLVNIKQIIFSSIPLAISTFIDTLNVNFQRIVIERFISIEEVGIYASLTTIMVSGQLVLSAFLTYFLPKLNNSIKLNDLKGYVKYLLFMVMTAVFLGIFLVISVILFSDNIVSILFTDEYIKYKSLLIIVMVTGLFWYISGTLYYGVIALNLYKAQMFSLIISFIINFIFTLILVQSIGIRGAAFALMLSMISRCICLSLVIIIQLKKMKRIR